MNRPIRVLIAEDDRLQRSLLAEGVHRSADMELAGLAVDGDEKVGVDIIRRSLEAPLRCIAENAGYEGSVEVAEVKKAKAGTMEGLFLTDLCLWIQLPLYSITRRKCLKV